MWRDDGIGPSQAVPVKVCGDSSLLQQTNSLWYGTEITGCWVEELAPSQVACGALELQVSYQLP